jgi:hypothetical protein
MQQAYGILLAAAAETGFVDMTRENVRDLRAPLHPNALWTNFLV